MLDKIQYYVRYVQQVINYAQKVISVVNTGLKSWPRWVPIDTEEKTTNSDEQSDV